MLSLSKHLAPSLTGRGICVHLCQSVADEANVMLSLSKRLAPSLTGRGIYVHLCQSVADET